MIKSGNRLITAACRRRASALPTGVLNTILDGIILIAGGETEPALITLLDGPQLSPQVLLLLF